MSRKIFTVLISSAFGVGVMLAADAQVQTASADPAAQAPAAQEPADNRTPTQSMTPVKKREQIHRFLYGIYVKQENREAQEQEVKELISLVPEDPVFHYALGRLLLKEGKYLDALIPFDDAIKVDRNYADAYASKGDCYSKMKKYKEAIDWFTQAQQHAKTGQNFKTQIDVNQQMMEKAEAEQRYLDQINKATGPKKKGK